VEEVQFVEQQFHLAAGDRMCRLPAKQGSDMKTMIVAAIALAMATGTALAQSAGGANGNGPAGPITPFTIWQMQSQTGKPLTPMRELTRMAHEGQGLNTAPAPRGVAEAPAHSTTVAPD
jgi:hypothetical protein